jgi:tetratricopeptide (TPR) repeat protein
MRNFLDLERREFAQLLLLSIVTIIVYYNTLFNYFVWDDFPILVNNSAYKSIALGRFFTTPANGLEYLPIRDISYAIDHAIWGGNPFGYHITNLLLYILNVVAVFFLIKRIALFIDLLGHDQNATAHLLPFMAAVFFAVHPIHSESVGFITCRNTLLSGLFTFICSNYYIRFISTTETKTLVIYFASLASYILAVLSKGSSIYLPILFVICLSISNSRRYVFDTIALIPFFLVAASVYQLFTNIALNVKIINPIFYKSHVISAHALIKAVQIPFFYFEKLLYPINLAPEYDASFHLDIKSFPAVIACFLIISLSIYLFFNRQRAPWPFFSWFWYITALIPVVHLVPTSTVVADRYAYLPSFAFCLFFAYVMLNIFKHTKPMFLYLFAGCVVFILSVLSIQQNRIWNNEISLWQHAVKTSPRSAKSLSNLGMLYLRRGNYAEAFKYLEHARAVDPGDPFLDYCRGSLAFDKGDYTNAIKYFQLAVLMREDLIDALYYIGNAYEYINDTDNAELYYKMVLNSSHPDLRFRLQASDRLTKLHQKYPANKAIRED